LKVTSPKQIRKSAADCSSGLCGRLNNPRKVNGWLYDLTLFRFGTMLVTMSTPFYHGLIQFYWA